MEIEVDYNKLNSISDRLSAFNDKVTNADILTVLATQIKDMIFLRTMSGKDLDGNEFKPYNRKYAEKKKSGVNLYSLNSGNHMLYDMAVRLISNEASEIYFRSKDKRELAYMHNTGEIRGGKKRKFFGLNNDDIKSVVQNYQTFIRQTLREQKLV